MNIKLNKTYKLILKIAVTAGLVLWLIYKIDWREVLVHIKKIDAWELVLFTLLYLLGILITSHRWRILADFKKIPSTLPGLYKIYLTGSFLNNFFPSIVGGDTYRSYTLGKSCGNRYVEAASTVMVDRITGLIGVMLIFIIFSLLDLKAVLSNKILITANLLVIASFGFDAFLIILKKLPIWSFAKRIIPEFIVKLIQEIQSYRSDYRVLGKAVAWGAVYNLIGVGFANWIIFWGLGASINFIDFVVAISIVSAISSLPISIGNLGVKEWAYVAFFGIFGVSAPLAVTAALTGRIMQMLVSFVAIPIYLKSKK
jgi:uncharacterized protein (TIRG00374 family)